MYKDVIYRIQGENPGIDVHLTDAIENEALLFLENEVLQLGGKQMQEYGLPTPNGDHHATSSEILRETSYNTNQLNTYVATNETRVLPEQQAAYDAIIDANRKQARELDILGSS